ncbi:hypothetical protein HanPSC8_Chr08g0333361 [Helianthus annuus]|nr:hypothetical protein HanPSC8_Chr08g0333361 [Helianthus annuus]
MDYGGNHVLRTVSDGQPAVVGIDGPMMLRRMVMKSRLGSLEIINTCL